MNLILAAYMILTCRASGGGFGACILNRRGAVGDDGKDLGGRMPFSLTWLPEVLFVLPFGLVWFDFTWRGFFLAAIACEISYLGMQTATGPALQWGTDPEDGMRRPRTLTPVVNWISDRFGFKRGDVNYCRTWMAVKGFLIGLPVGGVLLAVLWPLAYEAGHRLGDHKYSEMFAGLLAAIAIAVFVALNVAN